METLLLSAKSIVKRISDVLEKSFIKRIKNNGPYTDP